MSRLAQLERQVPLALRALRLLLGTPQAFVYPVVAAVSAIAMPVVLAAGLFLVDVRLVWLTVPGYILGYGSLFAVLMVAYCYELDRAFAGQSPPPGAGLRRVAGAPGTVILGGLVMSVLGMFTESDVDPPFLDRLGIASRWGLRAATVFCYPALAVESGCIRETLTVVQAAARDKWGSAGVASAGTQAVGFTVIWTSIAAAVALAVSWSLGVFSVDLPPLGSFAIIAVLPVFGFVSAMTLQFTVSGVVKTVLYRYATTDELPEALGADPTVLLDANESPASDPTGVSSD